MAMVARIPTNTSANALMAAQFTPRVAQVRIVCTIKMAAYIVASEQKEERNQIEWKCKPNQIK